MILNNYGYSLAHAENYHLGSFFAQINNQSSPILALQKKKFYSHEDAETIIDA